MQIDLAALGISKEDLTARVVDAIVESIMDNHSTDEYGTRHYVGKSDFAKEIDKKIQASYDEAISKILATNYEPAIKSRVENYIFQLTNEWGEKKGIPMSFTEYFIARIDKFLKDDVDDRGKSKDEYRDSYDKGNFRAKATRLAFHIDKQISDWMQKAISEILVGGTSQIMRALHETVRHQLNDVAAKMKFTVTTK